MFRKSCLFLAILMLVPVVAACASNTTTTATYPGNTVTVPGSTVTSPAITVTITSPQNTVTAIYTVGGTVSGGNPPTITNVTNTTAGQLFLEGEALYNANCTFTYCHAQYGVGGTSNEASEPAEIEFDQQNLSVFGNAGNLLTFVEGAMHEQNTALFLTNDEYAQIFAYILTQNGTLTSSSLISASNLSTIILPTSTVVPTVPTS
jgi:hypothetical protein